MIVINKIKEFSKKHYYAVIIFAFIMIYSFVVPGEFSLFRADNAILAIHAVDFGMGFCSKLLPGAIYNLFFDSVSIVKTSVYLIVLLTIFFGILSVFLEKFILSVDTGHRKIALIILAFFLTGPSTFAIHTHYPGMLDMYWVFCALMLFIFLSKKQLIPLVLLPFILCVTVYFASLICFIPFFVIIILYKISCTQDKTEKLLLWSVVIISAMAAVGLGVYFAVCETDNLVYTIDEFHSIYSERGVDRFFYFDQSLYKEIESYGLNKFNGYLPKDNSNIENIISEIVLRINYSLSMISLGDKLIVIFLISPAVILILSFLLNQIKSNIKKRNTLKLFSNICMLILPFFTTFSSVFFSEDLIRWIGHAFITLFIYFIFSIYNEGEESWCWIEDRISKLPTPILMIYFTLYATTIYHPYYIG